MTPWPCEDSGTLHFIACKAHIAEDRAVFTVRRPVGFVRKRKLGRIGSSETKLSWEKKKMKNGAEVAHISASVGLSMI